MKRNDRIFLAAVLIVGGVLAALSVQEYGAGSAPAARRGAGSEAAGKARDVDAPRLRDLIRLHRLSEHDALYSAPAPRTEKPEPQTSCIPAIESAHLMGTIFTITVCAPSDLRSARKAIAAAFDEVRRVEAAISDWREDSEASILNRAAGSTHVSVGPDLWNVVRYAQNISRASEGAFDITISPLVELWGFRDKTPRLPPKAAIDKTRRLTDYRELVADGRDRTLFLRRKGMKIDLGGIGKGYGVDRAAEALEKRGFRDFLISGSGELLAVGSKGDQPWELGIQDPRGKGLLQVIASSGRRALSTSGDYRNFIDRNGRRYGHVLDPRTGRPAQGVESVSVLATTSTEADALSTTLFVLGVEKGSALAKKYPDVEALFVDERGTLHTTEHWPGRADRAR